MNIHDAGAIKWSSAIFGQSIDFSISLVFHFFRNKVTIECLDLRKEKVHR